MTQYTNADTIKIWQKTKDMSVKEIIDYLAELLDDHFGSVQNECVFERLKEKLGLKFKMPNTNTKEEMLSFGCPENEILEVIEN